MFRNKTARQHNFATVPKADIPRSKFLMRQTRKMAFNASELVPIMVEEVLPGDTWQHKETIMARLATPIAPVVDDLDLETWYFFVPNRILDEGWEDLITGENTALVVPTITPVAAGAENVLNSVFDHMGIPPMVSSNVPEYNAYPIWGYFKIYNEWFRDQNLQLEWGGMDWVGRDNSSAITNTAITWTQACLRVNKRHDYFTSSLPWPQKGTAVSISLGTSAPLYTTGTDSGSIGFNSAVPDNGNRRLVTSAGSGVLSYWGAASAGDANVFADLTGVTAVTINALRTAAITQKILEMDARGGSRYVEQLLNAFGVRSPDYRMQRPEYLGGSKLPITVNPIAQTAAYTAEPGAVESAVGNLGAEMHASGSKRSFTYAATEHGYIIGLAAARATPTYQQGIRKHWLRRTRLDFWRPQFDGLGEQTVTTQEIFQTTTGTYANSVWGYQERAAEYRYTPNEITGVLRSTAPQPLDWWHYAEEFATEPALNSAFIIDKTQETLARSLATAPSEQWSAQIIMDVLHESNVARLMPAYGVPGIDRF